MTGSSHFRVLFVAGIALMIPYATVGQQVKPASPDASAPTTTFRVFTRMVTVEVVAKDKQGHVIPGLTAKDFQLFEQMPPKKDEKPQEIRAFVEVNPQAIAEASKQPVVKIPAGVYSNLVATRLAVPPTILLLDGLNTEANSGNQARRQMVKMLASIPPDTPVAVFLLGHDLVLLQSFTKDPKLLREVAQRVQSTNLDNGGLSIDPHNDASSLSNQVQEMFGGNEDTPPGPSSTPSGPGAAPLAIPSGAPGGELQMAAIRRFEKETFAANTDMRVRQTLDALRAIARHVSGYPGRKNLIWISSSFPLVSSPDVFDTHHVAFEGMRNYQDALAVATNALADAKVAVYPVNPAGVETQSLFLADRPPATPGYGMQVHSEARDLNRESMARFSTVESMTVVAKQTGGSICINNNDLGDCVKTAVDEGSSYYELAYYPNPSNWHGEFHRIVVKANRPGVQLSYREGYFAHEASPAKEKEKSGNDPLLQEAACGDLLTATSILMVGRALPPDGPKQAKYYLNVDTRMLTPIDNDQGKRELHLDFAVCAFDSSNRAVQYLQDSVSQTFSPAEYSSTRGIPHVVAFAPHEGATRVRLLVRDSATGRMGSFDVSYAGSSMAATPATGNATPSPAPAHN